MEDVAAAERDERDRFNQGRHDQYGNGWRLGDRHFGRMGGLVPGITLLKTEILGAHAFASHALHGVGKRHCGGGVGRNAGARDTRRLGEQQSAAEQPDNPKTSFRRQDHVT